MKYSDHTLNKQIQRHPTSKWLHQRATQQEQHDQQDQQHDKQRDTTTPTALECFQRNRPKTH